MKKLVLVRHGESTWNKENRFTGWTDVDLSPQGVEEARGAGRLLLALLREPASLLNYVGILITVIGVYLVLTEHITKVPRLDRSFLIIAALVPIDIAYALLVKTFLGTADPIALAVSIYILGK